MTKEEQDLVDGWAIEFEVSIDYLKAKDCSPQVISYTLQTMDMVVDEILANNCIMPWSRPTWWTPEYVELAEITMEALNH